MRDPEQDLRRLDGEGLLRRLRVLTGPQAPVVEVDGECLVNFSSNDYLGLADDEELKEAYREAISRHGSGSGASRLVSGTMAPHLKLEEKVAALKKAEAALTFSSGYATAVGVIPSILDRGRDDVVILDKLCHASLIDGARLSGARMRVFPHNDVEKLASHLDWARAGTGPDGRILVLTESVFSMDGDLAPLGEICRLKEEAGALLLVDEAHGFGVTGPNGRGVAAANRLERRIDFQMGTFSKAAGLSGGYLCAERKWIDWFVNRSRSFIYSTAPSPALAETISASLDIVTGERGDRLRRRLWKHVAEIAPDAPSAIIPILIGSSERAMAVSAELRNRGLLIPAIRYPTVPRNTARLRITLSAAHREEDLASLQAALEEVSAASREAP